MLQYLWQNFKFLTLSYPSAAEYDLVNFAILYLKLVIWWSMLYFLTAILENKLRI